MGYIERAEIERFIKEHGMIRSYDSDLLPDADVTPVRHGRWERVCTYRDETVFRCSNCNREVKVPHGLSKERWAPYCHCGTKMDLED